MSNFREEKTLKKTSIEIPEDIAQVIEECLEEISKHLNNRVGKEEVSLECAVSIKTKIMFVKDDTKNKLVYEKHFTNLYKALKTLIFLDERLKNEKYEKTTIRVISMNGNFFDVSI